LGKATATHDPRHSEKYQRIRGEIQTEWNPAPVDDRDPGMM
jgi:hypothetical protein